MSSSSSSALAAHLEARDKLIAQEKSLRFDSDKLANLSSAEKEAERIVRALRAEEHISVWETEDEKPDLFPGMHFLTFKETMEKTKLFKLLKTMPKGCILHCHMDAMCDARFLLAQALLHPEMHISSPETSLPSSGPFGAYDSSLSSLPVFKALPISFKPAAETSIYSSEYVPGNWVPLAKARSEHPGGVEDFDNAVLGLLIIEPGSSYEDYPTSDKIWKKFGSTFIVSNGLLGFEPIYRAYIKQVFYSAIEDGVAWVETRINFLRPTMISASGEDDLGHSDWMRIYDEMVEEVKKEMAEKGRADEFWGAIIIYTTIRFIDNDAIREAMEDCIALKKQYPHLIAGFDLVGHEDSLKPLKYYLESLLWFQERVKEEGLDIPFIFHAGETLGDGDAIDDNLFDAILLGTKRIGHGFSLAKHPLLMQLCRERKIAIEVCPISSEILRYTPSILNHPVQILLNNGVPVCLSCDDPQIFGNLGLSNDFYQVLVGSEATGLISLAVLAEQSIEYSCMNPSLKKRCLAIWRKQWAVYVDSIVVAGNA